MDSSFILVNVCFLLSFDMYFFLLLRLRGKVLTLLFPPPRLPFQELTQPEALAALSKLLTSKNWWELGLLVLIVLKWRISSQRNGTYDIYLAYCFQKTQMFWQHSSPPPFPLRLELCFFLWVKNAICTFSSSCWGNNIICDYFTSHPQVFAPILKAVLGSAVHAGSVGAYSPFVIIIGRFYRGGGGLRGGGGRLFQESYGDVS